MGGLIKVLDPILALAPSSKGDPLRVINELEKGRSTLKSSIKNTTASLDSKLGFEVDECLCVLSESYSTIRVALESVITEKRKKHSGNAPQEVSHPLGDLLGRVMAVGALLRAVVVSLSSPTHATESQGGLLVCAEELRLLAEKIRPEILYLSKYSEVAGALDARALSLKELADGPLKGSVRRELDRLYESSPRN